jgi:hypothetical protein
MEWNMESGIWNMESGIWNMESGMESGMNVLLYNI